MTYNCIQAPSTACPPDEEFIVCFVPMAFAFVFVIPIACCCFTYFLLRRLAAVDAAASGLDPEVSQSLPIFVYTSKASGDETECVAVSYTHLTLPTKRIV